MQTQQSEKIFFKFLIDNPEYAKFVTDRFFSGQDYKDVLPKVREFFDRYKQSPTRHQVFEFARLDPAVADRITEEKLRIMYETDLGAYDPVWLKESVEAWIEFKNLEISLFDVVHYVKSLKVSQDNVKEVVEKVKTMMVERNSMDFGFDVGLDFFDTANHVQPDGTYFSTGYPFLDLVLGGGWYRKGLFVFVAPPKTGKCFIDSTTITVRNKRTGIVETIEIGDFYKRLKV